MTIEPGERVTVMDELRTEEGRIVLTGSTGTLVGYIGPRYIVEVEDPATGERLVLLTYAWNVRRVTRVTP